MPFIISAHYSRHNKVISGNKSQYTSAILKVSHNIRKATLRIKCCDKLEEMVFFHHSTTVVCQHFRDARSNKNKFLFSFAPLFDTVG